MHLVAARHGLIAKLLYLLFLSKGRVPSAELLTDQLSNSHSSRYSVYRKDVQSRNYRSDSLSSDCTYNSENDNMFGNSIGI